MPPHSSFTLFNADHFIEGRDFVVRTWPVQMLFTLDVVFYRLCMHELHTQFIVKLLTVYETDIKWLYQEFIHIFMSCTFISGFKLSCM